MTLDELIAKLEAATGAQFVLDKAIGKFMGWPDDMIPPAYTVSLDAAKRLMPEGWEWQVSNRAPKPHTGRAYINNRQLINIGGGGMTRNPKYKGSECTAATPAIALCIACLKARQSGLLQEAS